MPTATGRGNLIEILRRQAETCERLDAPTYGAILRRAAADVKRGGPAWDVLRARAHDPAGSSVPLRFVAALHRAVLEEQAPELAPFFARAGGVPGDHSEALGSFLRRQAGYMREAVLRPCQTNEVGRSTGLLAGLLEVRRRTGLPIRLLEIGSSAGLNLLFRKYRFQGAGVAWGDPSSPVVLTDAFESPPPPLDGAVPMVERRGCDVHPLDPSDPQDRLTLLSSVWCDHVGRFRLLRAALDLAAKAPVVVARADAAEWLRPRLARPRKDAATVVFHSVVWQYMTPGGRDRVRALLEDAGSRSSTHAPVFWLRQEPAAPDTSRDQEIRLTQWPPGREDLLATVPPHGRPLRWLH